MNVRDQIARYGLTPDEVMDFAGALAAERLMRQDTAVTESPDAASDMFRKFLAGRSEEVFAVAFLDNSHRLIRFECLFRGTINKATVYPRVVVERALRYGAAAVILAHNHPSGSREPSGQDESITHQLSASLELFDIRVLDHFIIGDGEPVSMAARGMIGSCGRPVPRGFSDEQIAARKARSARQSEAMKRSWAIRKAKAATKLQTVQQPTTEEQS